MCFEMRNRQDIILILFIHSKLKVANIKIKLTYTPFGIYQMYLRAGRQRQLQVDVLIASRALHVLAGVVYG